jgi:hypothetical protein
MRTAALRLPIIVTALLLVAVTGCLASAAPAPPGAYFPLDSGWIWTFRTHGGPDAIMRVSSRQTVDGTVCRVIETVINGFVTQAECYRVTAGGVYAHQRSYPAGTVVLTPPQPVMTAPVQTGRTWRWNGRLGDQDVTMDFTWAREEPVTTPAGTFRAMLLYFATAPGSEMQLQTWRWFASGVGMVKEDTVIGQGGTTRRVYAELIRVVKGR